jgi:hypothetical protein
MMRPVARMQPWSGTGEFGRGVGRREFLGTARDFRVEASVVAVGFGLAMV